MNLRVMSVGNNTVANQQNQLRFGNLPINYHKEVCYLDSMKGMRRAIVNKAADIFEEAAIKECVDTRALAKAGYELRVVPEYKTGKGMSVYFVKAGEELNKKVLGHITPELPHLNTAIISDMYTGKATKKDLDNFIKKEVTPFVREVKAEALDAGIWMR